METFSELLNARRLELGLSIQDVASALKLKGIAVAYPTVAAWFNGGRGERWEPATLQSVLSLLQTDLASMVGGLPHTGSVDLSGPLYNAVAREIASLPEHQQVAVLSLIKSFRQ